MKYEEIFSVGFDRSYGGFDYAIKVRNEKLTRKEFNAIVSETYYALRELERFGVEDDVSCEEEKE